MNHLNNIRDSFITLQKTKNVVKYPTAFLILPLWKKRMENMCIDYDTSVLLPNSKD